MNDINFSEYIKENYNIEFDDKSIDLAIQGIEYCIENKIPILIIGNGGSAYLGSHFAQDLSKILRAQVWSLADNFGTIMAIANDIDYEYVFSYQLSKFNKYLLIAISYSGLSKNIILAAKRSKYINMPVLSFTGNNGGELKRISNLDININSKNIYVVESIFSMIFHFIIDILQQRKTEREINARVDKHNQIRVKLNLDFP